MDQPSSSSPTLKKTSPEFFQKKTSQRILSESDWYEDLRAKTEEHVKMKRAYIIPFFTGLDGKIKILVGKKQVLSYKAIRGINFAWHDAKNKIKSKWLQAKEKIKADDNPIEDEKSSSWKRLGGVLLHAGGRPAFFGGGKEDKEGVEATAIREFKEEFGCRADLGIRPEHLKEVHCTEWGGVYFLLCLNLYPELKKMALDLQEANAKIKEFEENVDLSRLPLPSPGKQPLPEMHEFSSLDLDSKQLEEHLNAFDRKDVELKAEMFSRFIFRKLGLGDYSDKKFRSYIMEHLEEAKIEDNIIAVKRGAVRVLLNIIADQLLLPHNWYIPKENEAWCYISQDRVEEIRKRAIAPFVIRNIQDGRKVLLLDQVSPEQLEKIFENLIAEKSENTSYQKQLLVK